jgi:uncharacterized damage-inducible protein DinB
MSAQTLFSSLFRYKASVDEELVEALTEVESKVPASTFKSALSALNHAHTVDRIFCANLQGHAHSCKASWPSDVPPLAKLGADIRQTDLWYIDYTARLAAKELEESIGFHFTDGSKGRMTREEMLAHVIAHSGYHRGEVGRLLPQIETTAMRDIFTGYLHRTEPSRRQ